MVFTNITPFPRTLTPVTNISPLTYRDAATFLEYLETIKQWLNETLVPDSNSMIENAIAEFQEGIANAEATIIATQGGWQGTWNEWTEEKAAEYLAFTNALNASYETFKTTVNTAIANHETAVDLRMDTAETDIATSKTEWQASWDAFIANVEMELAALSDSAMGGLINNPASETAIALKAHEKLTIRETVLNVRLFGLKGDGVTDDTAAFNAMIAALPVPADTFGTVAPAIYFPAGRYILDGGFTFTQRLTIRGDGQYQTILYRKPNATGDFITLAGSTSMIRDLTIDGNRNNGVTGDSIVLRSAYTAVNQVTLSSSGNNGITVGKGGGAIAHRIESVSIRLCADYGISVIAGSASTDGQWKNIGIGQCGLSGVRIANGAQNLMNVHSWGNGINTAPGDLVVDGAGFYLWSGNNKLVNCQAETNLTGFVIHGSNSVRNQLTGCYAWGNKQNGVFMRDTKSVTITGGTYQNNGIVNPGDNAAMYANIRNYNSTRIAITGVHCSDDSASVQVGSYTGLPAAPAYPFPGRLAGTKTVCRHYIEVAGTATPFTPDYNTVVGCDMPTDETTLLSAPSLLGRNSVWMGNSITGITRQTKVADGGSLFHRAHTDFVEMTGTGNINNIEAAQLGRRITLLFTDAVPGWVLSSGNIKVRADFRPVTGQTISFISDGVNWYETGRG